METPIRILACDDSVTIRKALELILVPAGFEVEFAVNGAEAIEKAKNVTPSILLLDFILPDMRGTEVCRELLADAQTRSIPVVLISARGAEIRQAYHDVENVIDYLTKPFTPDAVLGVIREVLATQPARAEEAARAAAATTATPPAAEPPAPAEVETPRPAALPSAAAPPPQAASDDEADDLPVAEGLPPAARHDSLETMFETLRAGLEGVYVEESDTPAGIGVDPAQSYTELASRLAQQLGETLEQAESRQRFRLYGDGSVRSLDESLLETYRRVCRLLFRAVAAGAVGESVHVARARVLAVCPRDGESHEHLSALAREPGEAHVFLVSSDYRQLPMLTRLYGPTHLVVDVGRGAAVLEQLKTLRAMPEARRMKVLAISRGEPGQVAQLSDLGADAVLPLGPGLQEAIRRRLAGVVEAAAPEGPTLMAASL